METKKLFGIGKGRRVLALTLSAVMTLSLAACGNKKENAEPTNGPAKEFVYVPEYISLAGENENRGYENMALIGKSLFYSEYSWNEETGESTNMIKEYSLTDGKTNEFPMEWDENQNMNRMVVDSEKNFHFLLSVYPEEPDANGEFINETFYQKRDAQGNVLTEQELTDMFQKDGEQLWPQDMAVDGEGNVYVSTDNGIVLLDASGAAAGMITPENGWINSMITGRDGKVYITYYDPNGGMTLSDVDFAGKKIANTFQNLPANLRTMCVASENTFLINDGTAVYEYDKAAQKYEEMFTWLDSDINGEYVQYFALSDDGKLLAMISDWGTGVTELAKMTKTKASELPQKEEIVFGTLYMDQELQAAAVNFNKKSDKYHVSIKTYVDQNNWTENSYNDAIAKLNNDLTSVTDCPDVLNIAQLNEVQLAAKNLFEDLTPYLENSSVLKKEDFVDGILDQYTRDGKLLSIPKTFNLSTVVGKTSLVGEEMGWTLDEMMAFAKEHPDAVLLDGMEKSTALYFCMAFNQDSFIDWAKGECHFDTDEFKDMLEFINMFPDEIDWEEYDGSDIVADMQADKVLLERVYISQIEDIQLAPAKFNEDVTYIGFPVTDDGVGCMLDSGSRYGITSKSGHKDGAWAFIESYMTDESGNMFSWGFPTLKERFQKQIDEAIERNKPSEDDSMAAVGMASVSMDGWEYTYHQPTDEEIALVQELISVARPAVSSNDEIFNIITEEADAYFKGQKSVDEVAGVIQSRAQIYVSENS